MDSKELEEFYDKKYPSQGAGAKFIKSKLIFSGYERTRITALESFVQMGNLASAMITNFIQTVCNPRVNIKAEEVVDILYDTSAGSWVVYRTKPTPTPATPPPAAPSVEEPPKEPTTTA